MKRLPEQFAHLEVWNGWCLPTETQRNHRRVSMTYEDVSAFGRAVLPDVEEICAYIDARRTAEGYDEQTRNLFYMLLSLAECAPAIESYGPEVAVVDGYDTKRFVADETHRLRPAI